jgi:hypothetical protein
MKNYEEHAFPDLLSKKHTVSVPAPSALKTNPEEASTSQQARPVRERRPNVKISGPEWLG